jgi:site-specific recombinase XerD
MMLEELERRNYSKGTIRNYLRFVERFAQHFGKSPDKLGPEHLRSYQAYLFKERKLCPGSVEHHVAALRFFFLRVLHRHEFRQFLPYPKVRRKLPNILSREEVARLIEASSSLFQRALLMVLYATGMRRAEVARMKIADIDSQRIGCHCRSISEPWLQNRKLSAQAVQWTGPKTLSYLLRQKRRHTNRRL